MATAAWLVGCLSIAVLATVTLAQNTTEPAAPDPSGDTNATATASTVGDFQCYVCDGEVAECGRTVNSSAQTTGCSGHCMTRRTGAVGAHVWTRSCEEECEETCLQAPPAETCTYCCQDDLCNGDLMNAASTLKPGIWISLFLVAHTVMLGGI
ncbi:Hypp2789 [Branchiostoma lanceolatum]|uniref:Hypp2789 protein n=1 Tax=Branchiostoma lanceolatum TaxID=7740 RepID=A0A8J9ZZ79_BRALA|nr:Hypp2789 [Branchiostoma lanceolatum]